MTAQSLVDPPCLRVSQQSAALSGKSTSVEPGEEPDQDQRVEEVAKSTLLLLDGWFLRIDNIGLLLAGLHDRLAANSLELAAGLGVRGAKHRDLLMDLD